MQNTCCFKTCVLTASVLRDCQSETCSVKFHHCCIAEFNVKFEIDETAQLCPLCYENMEQTYLEEIIHAEIYAAREAKSDMDVFYEQLQQNNLKGGGRAKKNPAWGFYKELPIDKNLLPEDTSLFYCTACYVKEPKPNVIDGKLAKKQKEGVIKYNKSNTASIKNHCKQKHPIKYPKFCKFINDKTDKANGEDSSAGSKRINKRKAESLMSSEASSVIMKRFLLTNKPYGKDSEKQKDYEQSLVEMTAEALTPLNLCELPSYRRHVALLDSRINPVSRTRLTRTLIPDCYNTMKQKLIDELKEVVAVSLSYDLWMTRKTEEVFSLNAQYQLYNVHLGMPYSRGGTDGQNLAIAVKKTIDEMQLATKVISYTQDGGSNLVTCKRALDATVDNSNFFEPIQPIFEQECTAHILQGACKAAVINVESDDKTISIEHTRTRLQACITWTKKSQKGQNGLAESQSHCQLPQRALITPVKTRFAYLVVSFRCLLENKEAIDYLYGQKPGMTSALRARKPTWQEWEIARMTVATLKGVVGAVTLNQAKGDKWLLSDAIDNLIKVFMTCYNGSTAVVTDITKQCDKILDDHDNSEEAETFVENLKEVSMKLCQSVKAKLQSHLDPLFNVRCPKQKAHMAFSMILDPRYLQLTSLLGLHIAMDCNSATYLSHINDMLLVYIVAAEEKENPTGAAPSSTNESNYVIPDVVFAGLTPNYMNQPNGNTTTRERAIRELGEFKALVLQFFSSGRKMETIEDVYNFYNVNRHRIPMIHRIAMIILSIPPSQINNERDFSLAGVIARARRASFTIKNLSMLVFINKNKALFDEIGKRNILEDKFEGMDDLFDEIEVFLNENKEIEE